MKNKTQQEWQTQLKQQAASRLSISAFCKKHRISQSSFYKHKKALTAKTYPHTPTFIQAKLPPVHSTSSSIKIQHQHTQLHLPETVSAIWLAELIKALA